MTVDCDPVATAPGTDLRRRMLRESMPQMSDRRSVFDLVEGFQLAHAVATLHDLELFTALQQPRSAKELSKRFAVDANLLRGLLEYVAARTDLLRKTGENFVATRNYSNASRFLLDLYLGAYGGNAKNLAALLRNPVAGPKSIDLSRHARAFAAVNGSPLGVLPELIRQLGFNHLLDLGCGNGGLLVDLAAKDPQFVGWGLELNHEMCKVARARIRAARAGKRLRVLQGDGADLKSALPAQVAGRVEAVTAAQVANEMFAKGHSRAIAWLRNLRKMFPGRPLLIADYCGRLGVKRQRFARLPGKEALRETLLHDYAQLISGQGVPPASLAEWHSIYKKAGCRLVHVLEDRTTTRFIHIFGL